MNFYIKYPPNGDNHFRRPKVTSHTWDDGHYEPAEWEPCTYGIEPEYRATVREIRHCESTFNSTGNSLYAFEAFRLATTAKLYPPLWVIEHLNERFMLAHTKGLSLDRVFGFSAKGLGKGKSTSPKKEDSLLARNRLLCLAIFKLEGAGLSRPAACKALSSLLARLPKNEKLCIGGAPSESLGHMDMTGKGIGNAVQESEDIWSGDRDETADAAKSWTDSEKRELLSIFYATELPLK